MINAIPKQYRKKSGIYFISNHKDHRLYIGSANLLERRFWQHLHLLRKGRHHSPHLQKFFNKYGELALTFSFQEECDIKDLLIREQYYLDLLLPFGIQGFNIATVAGVTLGYKHTDASRKVMSEKRMGVKPSNAAIENAKKYWLGRKHSDETMQKLFAVQSNKKYDAVARKNMSEAHKNIKQSEETKLKRALSLKGKIGGVPILNLETGIFYKSIKEAAASTEMITSHMLCKRLAGVTKNNTSFRYA